MKRIILGIVVLFSIIHYSHGQQLKPITSTDVQTIVKQFPKAIILDVRTPAEFSQGHIKNAINIDVNQPNSMSKYNALDKSKTYIIICRTKNRSGVVANYMMQNGFTKVYQVTDGMYGWGQNNLPIIK